MALPRLTRRHVANPAMSLLRAANAPAISGHYLLNRSDPPLEADQTRKRIIVLSLDARPQSSSFLLTRGFATPSIARRKEGESGRKMRMSCADRRLMSIWLIVANSSIGVQSARAPTVSCCANRLSHRSDCVTPSFVSAAKSELAAAADHGGRYTTDSGAILSAHRGDASPPMGSLRPETGYHLGIASASGQSSDPPHSQQPSAAGAEPPRKRALHPPASKGCRYKALICIFTVALVCEPQQSGLARARLPEWNSGGRDCSKPRANECALVLSGSHGNNCGGQHDDDELCCCC